jgi:AcrR family transcriptional regulator
MSQVKRRVVPGAIKQRSSPRRRPTSNPPHRRVRLENDQRRSQLLHLGRTAFADRSYDDVSIDDIATAAGISKGLLYHYFPTKRDLYLAGLRATAQALIDDINRQPASHERLQSTLDAYLTHAHSNASAYVALLRGGIGSDPEIADVADVTRNALLDAAHAEIPKSKIRDGATTLALRGWVGTVEAVTLDWIAAANDFSTVAVRNWLIDLLRCAMNSTDALA